jgi:hypothetical protein
VTLVVQISRGRAPAHAIASAARGAGAWDWPYRLVAGLPAVDAKNEAVRLAYEEHTALLLIEDDVLVPWDEWPTRDDAIYAADVHCRGGTLNTVRDNQGDVLYTGTCFVRVPWWALDAMGAARAPLFQPWVFQYDSHAGTLTKIEPSLDGLHSDVYFYWLARKCGVSVQIFGAGSHLLHADSGGGRNVSAITVV